VLHRRYEMVNPVLAEFLEEEKNFFVNVANVFKKFDGVGNKFSIIHKRNPKPEITYDPCKYIRGGQVIHSKPYDDDIVNRGRSRTTLEKPDFSGSNNNLRSTINNNQGFPTNDGINRMTMNQFNDFNNTRQTLQPQNTMMNQMNYNNPLNFNYQQNTNNSNMPHNDPFMGFNNNFNNVNNVNNVSNINNQNHSSGMNNNQYYDHNNSHGSIPSNNSNERFQNDYTYNVQNKGFNDFTNMNNNFSNQPVQRGSITPNQDINSFSNSNSNNTSFSGFNNMNNNFSNQPHVQPFNFNNNSNPHNMGHQNNQPRVGGGSSSDLNNNPRNAGDDIFKDFF
jgi:hypothetical protein